MPHGSNNSAFIVIWLVHVWACSLQYIFK